MLRWMEGWEAGIASNRYNAGSVSYGWDFSSGSGGAPNPAHTGDGLWVHPLNRGSGSYALALPHEATATTLSLDPAGDPDVESLALAFSLYLDTDTTHAHDVLLEILDTGGTPYVRVRTSQSGASTRLEVQVWDGSQWNKGWHDGGQLITVRNSYWVILEVRRGASAPYPVDVQVRIGTPTTAPVVAGEGRTQDLNSPRILGKLRWSGIVEAGGGHPGDTVVDSILLWTDPDGDLPYTRRRWWVGALEATADQSTTGPGTWTPTGTATNALALSQASGSTFSTASQSSVDESTLALELQDLTDSHPGWTWPLVRDVAGASVTFTHTNGSAGSLGGFLWRGGSFTPPTVDRYWGDSSVELYGFRTYGVDPTGEKWTEATLGDASLVLAYDPASGVASSVDFPRAVVQVAWNAMDPVVAPSSGPTGPDSYVLVHDPLLVATDASMDALDGVDTPSQSGPSIGAAYPLTTNVGNLNPFHGGEDWDTSAGTLHPTPVGLDYRLQVSGGVMGTAEWAWKFQDDPADRYRGQLDLRLERDQHNPWPTQAKGDSVVAFYSRAFRRVLVGRYRNAPDYRWELKYRPASVVNRTQWTGDAFIPNAAGFASGGFGRKLPTLSASPFSVMWETPDGALRFAYVYGGAGVPTNDLDVWGSVDGGLNWELLQEGVLSGVLGRNSLPYYITADTSGDWVRISFWDLAATPSGVVTLVSSDRGATWATVGTGVPDGTDVGFSANFNPERNQMHAIVGADTVDGLFIRFRKVSTDNRLRVEVATGDQEWSTHPQWTNASTNLWDVEFMESCAAVRTPTHLLFLMWESTILSVASNEDSALVGFGIQRDHLLDYSYTRGVTNPRTQEWTVFARDGQEGAHTLLRSAYYQPSQWRIAWVGDALMVYGATYNLGASTRSIQSWSVCSFLGGFDEQPTHGTELATVGRDTGLYRNRWLAHYGIPDTAAGSPWLWVSSGSPSRSLAFDSVVLNGAINERAYWIDSTFSYVGNWADQGVLEFTTRVASGLTYATVPASVADYDQPKAGIALVGTSAAGTTIHASIHFSPTGLHLLDQSGAGASLWVDTQVDLTTERTYRLRMANAANAGKFGAAHYVELQHKAQGTTGPWVSSGLLTIGTGHVAGKTTQRIAWGQVGLATGGGGISTRWWDLGLSNSESLGGIPGDVNPEGVRGVQCASYAHHVAQGVNVSWGGGGGFMGDQWKAGIVWEYGVDQLANPSPSMVWRTDGHTTTAVIFDAAHYRDTAGATVPDRFHHNAVALFRTNFRRAWVDYAEATAFSSTFPTAAMTVDAAVWSVRVEAAGTNTVDVESIGSPGSLDSHLRSNAVAGWLVEYAAATAGSTHDGKVYRIRESWDNRVRLDYTTVQAATALPAGGTLTFFPPWMVLPYREAQESLASGIDQRFMRLQLRTSEQIPEEDSGFQVGRMVAGMTLPIAVPLEWGHADDEEGNVDLFTSRNGVRSSYRQGPPRRTVEGTSVGDVSRWRDSWRGTVRTISQYDLHPMVLVRDGNSAALSALYARMVDSTDLANVGYRYNSTTGRWEAVGDVSMTWEEEV